MMWEAANAPTRNENLDEGTSGGYHTPPSHDPGRSRHHGHEYGHGHVNSISINSNSRRDHHHGSIPGGRSRHRTISSETVEAALSRLSKAYTSSIECIGAIHKTNQMIVRGEQQQQRNNQSNNIDNNNQTQNRARQTIARVSNAARNTLETAILLDPLMLPHIPFLHQSMLELSQSLSHRPSDSAREGDTVSSSSSASRWNAVNERRPLPPIISSAAHKSTLAKLAYLSLVNYSDLLQQGSGSLQTQTQTGGKAAPATVLDRGIVPRLKSLVSRPPGDNSNSNSNSNNGCWSPEDPEDTQRLAVAALCDAAKLDGSDPIVWLKLACASRRLESVVAEAKARASSPCVMTTLERSRHRRLQVHALQAGSVALPKHMPPNRTILRALEELRAEPEPETYESGGTSPTPRIRTKTMELTRYSWSVLGKMILRACKGEETMAPWEASGSSTSSLHSQASSSLLGLYQKSPLLSLFGSPAVVLKLSPMLVLPSPVLGKICQYLENTSIWKFEATCRALSVNILAARALMEEHNSDDDDDDDDDEAAELLLRQQEIRQKELLQKFESRKSSQEQSKTENDTDLQDKPTNDDDMDIETETKHDDNTNNNSSENSNNNNDNDRGKVNYGTSPPKAPSQPQRQSSRTSKRLRSQQISTGKKQDRTAKRKSFDYCFVAATLSCTKEKHNELARGLRKTSEFAPLFRGGEPPGSTLGGNSGRRKARSSSSSSSLLDAPGDGKNPKQTEARERIGNASLSAFVKRWTYKNSGPMDLLERYLVHVALYVEDVFASDSPTMGLHSCVISAFQTLLLRSGSHQCIVPKFFRPMTETGSLLRSLETFAMDLVYAELILRQCDRYSPKVVEFDDDANLISLMVPGLVESCHQLKEEIGSKSKQQTEQTTILDGVHFQKFHRLEIRCYWLTACFFLWRSRIARAIYMSREAEDEGIHFIGLAIDCFESPNLRSVVRVIKTPHLGSPGREDAYWHEISPESLSKFRDEIQASSVVSHARQRFQELVAQLKPAEETDGSSTKIATEDASALVEIGQKLFERYNSQYGSAESKLVELVENFLEACGGALLSQLNPQGRFERADVVHNDIKDFIQLEPYTVEDLKKVSNPTILSMLVICLNMNESNRLSVAQLLLRLVLTTKDCHGLLLKQIADYRATRKNSDGYQSDDAMSDSDDDMSGIGPQSSQKEDDEKRARQCGHLIKLLIKCLCIALQSYLSEDEKKTLLTSNEFSSMISSVLDFSNQWYQSTVRFLSIPNDTLDQDLVRLTRILANESESLRERSPESKSIESIFFRGLVKIVISQHEVLKSLVNSQVDRSHRTARQRLCIKRAHFIGIVASELGTMLSTNLATSKDSVDVDGNSSLDEIEATQVRRGLSKQLALGPLPIVTSDSKSKSETGTGDDRAQTICNEIAITKKFNAIVDDLCLSDADNWESWYRAGQCCMMKADAIADRLGLTEGFSRTTHFSIPSHRGSHQRSLEILKLHDEQEREEKMFKEMNLLGHDYSLYINHAWSSFPSLREFTKKMKQSCVNESSEHKKVSLAIWKELDSRYEEGKYLEWQEVCGSLFVAALRNLSARFLSVALYILQSKPEINSDIKVLLSDVCETLGNIFYTELMASQKYGVPMRALTSKRKRDIATTAKACYLASIKHADDSVDEGDDSDDHSTWDLQFMVGKCDEKIAGTYDQEAFVKQTDSTGNNIRLYEQHTSAAMLIYQRALSEATKLEDAGSQLLDSGGSGHGSTELLYRLHASRLKCLIRAVSRKEEERDEAVLEALRLTEKHRFKELDFPVEALESSLNERIWIVFADIVNGLAECRKLKPFFHRSVYRHAQALMWSPVLYNPSSNKGSMDIIPESHSCQIKDLDGSKPVAFSAESVLGVLFDKKRVQLCAVWVTNSGAASPFQAMNSTVRKYDSLRGKYIGAYLETLRICNRRPEVETLMKWLYTSRRDRPSYFQAGAMNCGGKPTVSHSQDSLLTVDSKSVLMSRGFLLSAKRKANGVLADILMHEMSKRVTATASSKTSSSTTTTSSDLNKMTEFYLKHSYACFLRLNCSVEDLGKARAWKYGSTSLREVDAMCQAYLSLGDSIRDEIASTGTSDFGDWSGGGRKSVIFKAALAKCKTLFPTLSANAVFGKSKSKKGKSSSNHTQDAQDPDEFKSGKRKSPSPSSDDMNLLLSEGHPSSELETKKVSFEVAVPVGLTSGDTFLTTVSVAGSSRKVKLRVPEGDHSTLRFNMYVPKSKISQESKKPKLND
eukprot:jgi/Psemu1/251486/estExt_Genewise1Plus.C_300056